MAGLCPDTPIIKEVSRALAARLNRARGSLFTFFIKLIKKCRSGLGSPHCSSVTISDSSAAGAGGGF